VLLIIVVVLLPPSILTPGFKFSVPDSVYVPGETLIVPAVTIEVAFDTVFHGAVCDPVPVASLPLGLT
jgi:hypothetical protein